jgi:hypothetical protein
MLTAMPVTWTTAMMDLPADTLDAATRFWCAVAGATRSPSRGPEQEFRTLLPPAGDPALKVQRLGDGPARVHLDLAGPDPAGNRARAERLGARLLDDSRGHATYSSPYGLVFCVVTETPTQPPAPVDWGTHTSVVDQVCLDVPADRFDEEAAFWAGLLERDLHDSPGYAEFARLDRAAGDPLRFLLQRCGFDGPVRAHLDLATTSRAAEVDRITALGAPVVRVTDGWTTLRDPAGLEFCMTDRDPRPAPISP